VNPGDRPDDTELVARARRGDEDAMAELADRHYESVYRVALGIVRDADLAADVTQDAFIKALRGLGGFRGDSTFRTWLLTIASNQGRGALRSRGRRHEAPLDAVAPVAAPDMAPDERAGLLDAAAHARACLARLPEKQRMAVQLRLDEGLSFREIGRIIGSSEGASRVNYHHGIRRLREMLGA
jgi:RNA polymerase sigma-70 factor (ECF subfamily)